MSKERLAEITNKWNGGSCGIVDLSMMAGDHMNWLIGQAELTNALAESRMLDIAEYDRKMAEQVDRVRELEGRIADDEHYVPDILAQNKRYREVMERALELIQSDVAVRSEIEVILRKALEGESQ